MDRRNKWCHDPRMQNLRAREARHCNRCGDTIDLTQGMSTLDGFKRVNGSLANYAMVFCGDCTEYILDCVDKGIEHANL